MESSQYMEIFIEEGEEHIQNINDMLLELETDTKNLNYINEMFRSAHTIKGMAGTMGFRKIAELTHSLENILDAARNQTIEIQADVIDCLFEGIDTLEFLFNQILDGYDEDQYDIEPIKNKLIGYLPTETVQGTLNTTSNVNIIEEHHIGVIKDALKKDIYPYCIEIELEPTCLMKSARAYIIFKELEEYGEIISANPPVEDIERGEFDLGFSLVVISNMLGEDIKDRIEDIPEVDNCTIENLDIEKIQRKCVQPKAGGKNIKPSIKKGMEEGQSKGNTSHMTKNIRVDVTRLDNLMNLVSELIIVKNTIEDIKGYEEIAGMVDSVEYLQRVTSELHEAVMQVRMVPIGMVFNRFPRVVRDLSKQLKKEINLNIHGEETEVDRTIIDEIGDPLLHLIRNSADHGIESPNLRAVAGKDSAGNIDLYAYHDGNNIVIEVKDDGQGIDVDEIKDKLAMKSILSDGEIAKLEDNEIVQYLFHPGFSTSKNVSNISGRGVGLDVVQTTIESLGGIVEVETTEGAGTRFIIRLPLTLSIIKALLVKIGNEAYAIPLNSVREVVELSSSVIEIFDNREIISLRGELMPFIRLHNILEIDSQDTPNNMTVIIVNKGDRPMGLLVDSLIGQQDIVIKSLGKYLSNIDILSGATILGDGSLALILDINNIV